MVNYTTNIITLNQKQKELENELSLLKENELDLKNEIEKLKDPDYIARFARENYLYSKNGEYIIKIEDKNITEEKKEVVWKDDYNLYISIGSGVFVALILVIWIRKKAKN